jgi:alpha-D-ribose 1-methylphosphonate 5-triphosphate diphosphatase
MELGIRNAKVVTTDEVFDGGVNIVDGMIRDISSNGTGKGTDFEGDYLIPGLIEAHTDNLECHLMPRPGVDWPSPLAALMAHDSAMISSGITTALDSVYVGFTASSEERSRRALMLDRSIKAINQATKEGLLRADHLLHLRCEVTGKDVVDSLRKYLYQKILALISFMDHTPGQRQWTDVSKWRLFHSGKKWTDEQAAERLQRLRDQQDLYADKHRALIADMVKERGLPLASHDDTLPEHVDEGHELGVVISEFPTTLEAAKRARDLGMHVMGGTPNLVRGESHSGNISIRELAKHQALDCLSSDYVPVSLLHAAFVLHQELDYALPEAVKMITATPAAALGLSDRGSIETGLRADMLRVRIVDNLPVVISVWREGKQVH